MKLIHITTVSQTLNFLIPHFRELKLRGVDVNVVSAPGPDLERISQQENVPAFAVEMTRQITPWQDFLALTKLVRIFRQLKPDVVHAHTPKGGLLGMLAAKIAGVAVRVYHVHGLPLETATGLKRKLLAWSERVSCRCATQVFSVGNSLREVVIQEQLCSAERIRVIGRGSISGIDARTTFIPYSPLRSSREEIRSRWKIDKTDTVIGFVGRLVRDKGIRELAQAWEILRMEYPHLHLLVVGDFEFADSEMETVNSRFRNDSRVHFTGHSRETPSLYSAMDMLVLPTYREGLPYVPLEAAAMQLPVVASRVTGCVDVVVDGITGTLIPPRDSNALATAVREYIEHPELRMEHGTAARARVLAEFCPEEICTATYEEYRCLLAARGVFWPGDTDAAQTYRPAA